LTSIRLYSANILDIVSAQNAYKWTSPASWKTRLDCNFSVKKIAHEFIVRNFAVNY